MFCKSAKIFGMSFLGMTFLFANEMLVMSILEAQSVLSQIAEKDAALEEIQISKAWRFALFLREIRLKLIPRGSRLEKWARLLFQALRVWKNEGIAALGKKVKDHFALSNHNRLYRKNV